MDKRGRWGYKKFILTMTINEIQDELDDATQRRKVYCELANELRDAKSADGCPRNDEPSRPVAMPVEGQDNKNEENADAEERKHCQGLVPVECEDPRQRSSGEGDSNADHCDEDSEWPPCIGLRLIKLHSDRDVWLHGSLLFVVAECRG